MLEYVLALAGLLIVVLLLIGNEDHSLRNVTVKYAERTENLVSSEYP